MRPPRLVYDSGAARRTAHNNIGHLLQGRAGKNSAEIERALQQFELALHYVPLHVDSMYNKGNGLYILNRFQRAVAVFRQVLQLQPGHAGARLNLGNILMTAGDTEAALRQGLSIVNAPPGAVKDRERVAALIAPLLSVGRVPTFA